MSSQSSRWWIAPWPATRRTALFLLGGALSACGPEPHVEPAHPPAKAPTATTVPLPPTATATATEASSEEPPWAPEPRCSSAGYCWESPELPLGDVKAVWASGPKDIYAVGPRIFHFDGSAWTEEQSEATEAHAQVWGSGPDNVYAVTENGSLLHRSKGVWTLVADAPEGLSALWGSGPSDVFALHSRGKVAHFDGKQWTSQTVTKDVAWNALWGSGPKDVFAGGGQGGIGVVLHYDGATWKTQEKLGQAVLGVWGSGPSAVWAAGIDDHDQPAVWRFNGSQWTAEKIPAGGVPVGVAGTGGKPVLLGTTDLNMTGPAPFWKQTQRVFVVEPAGAAWKSRDILSASPLLAPYPWSISADAAGTVYVAGGWSVVGTLDSKGFHALLNNAAPDKSLKGVWGTSPTDVVAVGSAGALLHYDGSTWTADPSGAGHLFTGIHGGKDLLAAIAVKGKLLVREHGKWTDLRTGTSSDLLAVWTSGEDIFAGGDDGAMVHCLRGSCTRMKMPSDATITTLWGRSPKDVFAGSQGGGFYHWNGAQWSVHSSVWNPSVTGTNQGPAEDGEGIRYITAIGSDNQGGMLVETSDGSYQVTKDTWTRLGDGGGLTLTDGAGGDIRTVYGGIDVGTPTQVRRFDGKAWQDEPLPTSRFDDAGLHMRALWSGGGHVFVVGDCGTILHKKP